MKIGQKIILAKKLFQTYCNFWIVNSVPKMNILSLKMDLQSPCQVNRKYIRKNSERGITQQKIENSKF